MLKTAVFSLTFFFIYKQGFEDTPLFSMPEPKKSIRRIQWVIIKSKVIRRIICNHIDIIKYGGAATIGSFGCRICGT